MAASVAPSRSAIAPISHATVRAAWQIATSVLRSSRLSASCARVRRHCMMPSALGSKARVFALIVVVPSLGSRSCRPPPDEYRVRPIQLLTEL
jgi:hypothetical protein